MLLTEAMERGSGGSLSWKVSLSQTAAFGGLIDDSSKGRQSHFNKELGAQWDEPAPCLPFSARPGTLSADTTCRR